ncbi:histidine kinase [Streptomyces sp. NPDC003077]|uniref:sensor histidine kinase n=1 Tax=Streptomyces sp. NPDC003077 TaxID=3154443 RepID=UPI0033B8BA6B
MIRQNGKDRAGAGFLAALSLVVKGPAFRDGALWAVLSLVGVAWFVEAGDATPSVVLDAVLDVVLPVVVLAVAVPGGRRWPGAAVVAVNGLCALGLTDQVSPGSPYLLPLAVMSYLLGIRSASARSALLVLGGCVAVDLAVCALLRTGAVWWFYTVTLVPGALLLPWLAGCYRRARLALVRGGWERAVSLEQRQRSVVEQARLRERTRIAADMHDSLGHELSLIALRAGALELEPALTDEHRADVTALRSAVSDAVEHLRDTIGVLREGTESGPDASPAESVEELVRRASASGVEVALHREGEAPALAPLADRAVYRVVQESLTNATKHAPGSAVRVRITHKDGKTEVRVVNSPGGSKSAPARASGHRGLTGMRERVRIVGGTLRAGPRGGGFEVVATVPDRVGPDRSLTAGRRTMHEEEESTHQLAVARRRARLRFAAAFLVPAGIGLTVLPAAALLAYQLTTCVLRPTAYEALRPGQQRERFADVLPARQFPYPSAAMRSAPTPPGSACEFYRSNGNLLEEVDVYRLCFAGSRLVAKDVLPRGADGS